jgi:hypothetical protein
MAACSGGLASIQKLGSSHIPNGGYYVAVRISALHHVLVQRNPNSSNIRTSRLAAILRLACPPKHHVAVCTLGPANYHDPYTALVPHRRFDDRPVALRADILIRCQCSAGFNLQYGAKCLSETEGRYGTDGAFRVRLQKGVCSPPRTRYFHLVGPIHNLARESYPAAVGDGARF